MRRPCRKETRRSACVRRTNAISPRGRTARRSLVFDQPLLAKPSFGATTHGETSLPTRCSNCVSPSALRRGGDGRRAVSRAGLSFDTRVIAQPALIFNSILRPRVDLAANAQKRRQWSYRRNLKIRVNIMIFCPSRLYPKLLASIMANIAAQRRFTPTTPPGPANGRDRIRRSNGRVPRLAGKV